MVWHGKRCIVMGVRATCFNTTVNFYPSSARCETGFVRGMQIADYQMLKSLVPERLVVRIGLTIYDTF